MGEEYLSRFAFVFLIYAVITSGYINEILSCQMRYLLTTSSFFRHILGILLIFVFIMLEGGWSFNKEIDDLDSNNWASGNTIDTIYMALGIYILFVISSKSRVIPNLIFFSILFVLYMINTYRTYLERRKLISEDDNNLLRKICIILFIIALIVLILSFIDYYIYQRYNYGKDFNNMLFIFGTSKCKSLEGIKE